MIPDHYWRILRNWYFLIGGFALACALIAAVVLPSLLFLVTPAPAEAPGWVGDTGRE